MSKCFPKVLFPLLMDLYYQETFEIAQSQTAIESKKEKDEEIFE